jgi:hypothetical protein
MVSLNVPFPFRADEAAGIRQRRLSQLEHQMTNDGPADSNHIWVLALHETEQQSVYVVLRDAAAQVLYSLPGGDQHWVVRAPLAVVQSLLDSFPSLTMVRTAGWLHSQCSCVRDDRLLPDNHAHVPLTICRPCCHMISSCHRQ